MRNPGRIMVINEPVVCVEPDSKMVLLNVDMGVYSWLEAPGTESWTVLARGADEDAIVGKLPAEYEVGPEQFRAGLAACLDLY